MRRDSEATLWIGSRNSRSKHIASPNSESLAEFGEKDLRARLPASQLAHQMLLAT